MHASIAIALWSLLLLQGCSASADRDPGDALLDHLLALAEAARAGDDCQASLAAARAYLDGHRADIEALKAQLVARQQALGAEERAGQIVRLRDRAEERIGPAMAALMALGARCPGEVPALKEAMAFAEIARRGPP